jgi:hypothetical protein
MRGLKPPPPSGSRFSAACKAHRLLSAIYGTLRLRSEFVTFLIIHDFLGRKPFVFSIDFCAKTKKSQPLRAGFKVVP